MFFHFEPLSIPDVIRITPARHDDDRGIPWPVENPTLSARDLSLPGLESATGPFQYVQ
jgi:dTDP-4-dehydrorhamnose 3,5-epimerase-like enzyme